MKPVVHVVDADPRFGECLRARLEAEGYALHVHADAAAFLRRFHPDQAGCLLLDVTTPGMSALQLQEELERRALQLPIIFVTAHREVAVTAVRPGALEFVERPFDHDALTRLVRDALQHDTELRCARAQEAQWGSRLASLSPRELDVLERVLAGKLNKIIAEELRISVKTVEFHRKRIMHKLDVKTAVELVQRVVRHRLSQRKR